MYKLNTINGWLLVEDNAIFPRDFFELYEEVETYKPDNSIPDIPFVLIDDNQKDNNGNKEASSNEVITVIPNNKSLLNPVQNKNKKYTKFAIIGVSALAASTLSYPLIKNFGMNNNLDIARLANSSSFSWCDGLNKYNIDKFPEICVIPTPAQLNSVDFSKSYTEFFSDKNASIASQEIRTSTLARINQFLEMKNNPNKRPEFYNQELALQVSIMYQIFNNNQVTIEQAVKFLSNLEKLKEIDNIWVEKQRLAAASASDITSPQAQAASQVGSIESNNIGKQINNQDNVIDNNPNTITANAAPNTVPRMMVNAAPTNATVPPRGSVMSMVRNGNQQLQQPQTQQYVEEEYIVTQPLNNNRVETTQPTQNERKALTTIHFGGGEEKPTVENTAPKIPLPAQVEQTSTEKNNIRPRTNRYYQFRNEREKTMNDEEIESAIKQYLDN